MQKKPVIVNEKCAAFVELVDDGVNGLLANRDSLAGKIGTILKDPRKAREMGKEGFERVSTKFTWEEIGKEANQLLSWAVPHNPE
jgi:glycosyltransferase involved in cell wall biosynthesis